MVRWLTRLLGYSPDDYLFKASVGNGTCLNESTDVLSVTCTQSDIFLNANVWVLFRKRLVGYIEPHETGMFMGRH